MKTTILFSLSLLGLTLAACDPFGQGDKNQSENITRVYLNVHCTDSNSLDSLGALWTDTDGPGGKNPTLPDTMVLTHDKEYNVSLYLGSNTSSGQPFDITSSIEANNVDHIVCYEVYCVSTSSGVIQISRLDKDKNNLEVGLKTLWKIPNNPDVGKITVRLKHQPNVKNGSCDPGETDVMVEYPFRIR